MYDEIVPDSEPEREEQRRNSDQERRMKRARKRLVPEPTRRMSLVLSSSPEPDLSVSFGVFPLLFARDLMPFERVAVTTEKENPFKALRH